MEEVDWATFTGTLPPEMWKIEQQGDLILASCWARGGFREWVVVSPPAHG